MDDEYSAYQTGMMVSLRHLKALCAGCLSIGKIYTNKIFSSIETLNITTQTEPIQEYQSFISFLYIHSNVIEKLVIRKRQIGNLLEAAIDIEHEELVIENYMSLHEEHIYSLEKILYPTMVLTHAKEKMSISSCKYKKPMLQQEPREEYKDGFDPEYMIVNEFQYADQTNFIVDFLKITKLEINDINPNMLIDNDEIKKLIEIPTLNELTLNYAGSQGQLKNINMILDIYKHWAKKSEANSLKFGFQPQVEDPVDEDIKMADDNETTFITLHNCNICCIDNDFKRMINAHEREEEFQIKYNTMKIDKIEIEFMNKDVVIKDKQLFIHDFVSMQITSNKEDCLMQKTQVWVNQGTQGSLIVKYRSSTGLSPYISFEDIQKYSLYNNYSVEVQSIEDLVEMAELPQLPLVKGLKMSSGFILWQENMGILYKLFTSNPTEGHGSDSCYKISTLQEFSVNISTTSFEEFYEGITNIFNLLNGRYCRVVNIHWINQNGLNEKSSEELSKEECCSTRDTIYKFICGNPSVTDFTLCMNEEFLSYKSTSKSLYEIDQFFTDGQSKIKVPLILKEAIEKKELILHYHKYKKSLINFANENLVQDEGDL
ncbi:unnamed protein product [Moneuplotes crassus]|uniref:Uncharacterized protein n=1 Tax=Euplotes crassus TaxID=5936 RepID=A0AAD1UDB4_EUPCR|nr:unnamed protein product [Moneuplotes crassus]